MSLQKRQILSKDKKSAIESVHSNPWWQNLPVADSTVMEVEKSVESLSHNDGSLCLSQVLSLSDKEEEFSSLAESIKRQKVN